MIAREPFSRALFGELVPLAQRCWKEGTKDKGDACAYHGERDYDIEPDVEQYERLGPALIILTLRDDRRLVGYGVGFTHRGLHHKHITCAIADSLYIEPEHRAHFPELIGRFERELAQAGAQIIGWPVSPNGALYPLLLARGYVADDIVMEKRVCA